MRLLLTLLLFMLSPFAFLYAQEKTFFVTGHVLSQQLPVELANVSLLNNSDSSFIDGSVSDSLGHFKINKIAAGRYLLKISRLSYEKRIIAIDLTQVTDGVDLGPILIDARGTALKEVTTTASKALFTKEKGKLIFNVENSIVGALRTDVVEMISSLPGVRIDRQSNILLNGQEKVRVTINDRPTYLSRGDLLQMLKAIPVSNVKVLEIITNPSAKNDAEGSVVINIKTKEKVDAGFTGVLNTGFGSSIGYGRFYPRANSGLDLSLGKKNISVFLNYNYGYKKSLGEISETLFFEDATLNQSIQFESLPEQTHTLTSGVNLKVAKNQSASFFYTKNYSRNKIDQSNYIRLSNLSATSTDVISFADEIPKTNQDAINFSYDYNIDSLNTLRLSADHIHLNKDQLGNYENSYLTAGTSRIGENITNNSSTGISVWAGQVDYSLSVNKRSKFEAGLKFSNVKTENIVDFRGTGLIDSTRQNAFAYTENLAAGYLNYKTEIKRLGISAGIRYENSKMLGSSSTNLFRFERDFSGFFPSFSLDHPLTKTIDLNFAYSRRIARPNYVDINPFIYYVNPYVVLEGNPNLVPSYTNKFELTAQLQKKYTLSLTYLHTKDVFTTAQFQDIVQKKQRLIPANVGDLSNIELNLGVPFAPAPWWESYFNIGVVYQKYIENELMLLGYKQNSKTSFQLFSQHAFTLPKAISLEIDNTLISPSIQGQFTFSTIYSFSAGFKKSFFKNKLDLKIGMNDFLKTLRYDGSLQGIKWRSEYKNAGDSRQLKATLRYNFYSKGKIATKKAKWISDDEKKRMK
jgi:iron complex outermembrane receptor protein